MLLSTHYHFLSEDVHQSLCTSSQFDYWLRFADLVRLNFVLSIIQIWIPFNTYFSNIMFWIKSGCQSRLTVIYTFDSAHNGNMIFGLWIEFFCLVCQYFFYTFFWHVWIARNKACFKYVEPNCKVIERKALAYEAALLCSERAK